MFLLLFACVHIAGCGGRERLPVASTLASERASTPRGSRIVIKLPLDRTRWGTLTLVDDAGVTIAGPFPVLGKSTGRDRTNTLVNPNRDPLLPYGDTPIGAYRIDGFAPTGNARYDAPRFGNNFVIQMTPTGGEAAQAAKARTGILIHAGRPRSDGSLAWTQGCLRVHEETMVRLFEAIMIHGAPPVSCEAIAVDVSDLVGESHDPGLLPEGDPPRLAGPLLLPMPVVRRKGSTILPDGTRYDGDLIAGAATGEGTLTFPGGDRYTGEVQEGVPRGAGTMMYANGDSYESKSWPLRVGGIYRFANGDVIYGAHARNVDVSVRIEYANGDVYDGTVRNGKPHGQGYLTHRDGTFIGGIFRDGKYVDGFTPKVPNIKGPQEIDYEFPGGHITYSDLANGIPRASVVWDDGRRYEGGWSASGAQGHGEYWGPHGAHYTGAWVAGKRSGQGEYSDDTGYTYSGGWADGKRHGQGHCRLADGTTYDGAWGMGFFAGEGVLRVPDGRVIEGLFSRGELVSGRMTNPDGSRFEGTFEAGMPKSGTFFDAAGRPKRGDGGSKGHDHEPKDFRDHDLDRPEPKADDHDPLEMGPIDSIKWLPGPHGE